MYDPNDKSIEIIEGSLPQTVVLNFPCNVSASVMRTFILSKLCAGRNLRATVLDFSGVIKVSGLADREVMSLLQDLARAHISVVLLDTKNADWESYKGNFSASSLRAKLEREGDLDLYKQCFKKNLAAARKYIEDILRSPR